MRCHIQWLLEREASAAQEVTDTVGLRRRIGESFELAALPGTTEEDRKKALHFCVVGGGPTGSPSHAARLLRRIHCQALQEEQRPGMCVQASCLWLSELAGRIVTHC